MGFEIVYILYYNSILETSETTEKMADTQMYHNGESE